ncbi:MAG: right-handed parallel beta-helix repeat-containing protein [Myxococcales bacterium]|nr:right-handed parallel beta-helix repeat-containing protein [Myxococcales bacterium]
MHRRCTAISLLAGALAWSSSASALDVWVSSATGNDANPGTEQAPFATLGRACDETTADPLLVVHVGAGVYRELVQVVRNGTHILVAQADRGSAVLTGAEPSAGLGWTHADPPGLPVAAAGQIWWADLAAWEYPPQIVTQRLPDTTIARLPMAREPDWSVTTEWKWHEHWQTASVPLRYWADESAAAEVSAHYLSSPFLQQWGDLTGARVWIKDTVTGHDTYSAGVVGHWPAEGTIEVSRPCHVSGGDDGLGAASKFVLENAAALLDEEGEWFYDAASARLYVWPVGGGDPGALELEIARRKRGIATAASDVVVDGLTLRGFNYQQDYWGEGTRDAALSLRGGSDAVTSGITVRNCVIEHAARGIDLVADSSAGVVTIDGLTIEDTTIRHIDGHGINVQSWPNDAIGIDHITVQRCLLSDLGFRNPEPTNSMTGASFSRVKNLRFLDNEVDHTPHNAVGVNYGCENVLLKGNHVHHCGLNSADNGCVKFWNNTDTFDLAAPRSILATENLVHDSMGWAHSSEVNQWWQTTGLSGSGFYCDYYRGVTFYRNIVHTVGAVALWPNTPSNLNWMIHNTVLEARHGASCSRETTGTPGQGEGLVMNNLFMNFTTWGFPQDYYWGQLESGLLYSLTDDLLVSHHNGFHDVYSDMLYVDASNNGNKYVSVADVTANTPYEQGSIDMPGDDATIVVDAANWDVRPVPGSPVLDAAAEPPPELAALFTRLGLTLPAPVGAAYDLGAIEGSGPPWLRVTYPNGGEILPTGGQATVTWDSAAFVGPVRIELATGYASGPAWQVLVTVTANDGSELVALPAVRDASCRIRVSETSDGDPTDVSDADFEIGDAIIVMSPVGGEVWPVGQSFDVTWSSGGVADVHVELSRDAGATWETLAASVPAADGRFAWTVTGPASSASLARLTDAADDDPVGVSPATFSIVEPAVDAAAEGDGGCSCRLGGRRGDATGLAWLVLGALPLLRRRGAAARP